LITNNILCKYTNNSHLPGIHLWGIGMEKVLINPKSVK
jgi:hypothetical protein